MTPLLYLRWPNLSETRLGSEVATFESVGHSSVESTHHQYIYIYIGNVPGIHGNDAFLARNQKLVQDMISFRVIPRILKAGPRFPYCLHGGGLQSK